MGFGKDIFCHGIEPYNFRDTEDTVATITANVGQSTAIGPKVAIRWNKPFPPRKTIAIDMGGSKSTSNLSEEISPTLACTHYGEPVIGTIDASIYKKNNNQDNTKYIIRKFTKGKTMEKVNPTDIFRKAIGQGRDVLSILNSAEALLRIVKEGVMNLDEAITALGDIRSELGGKAKATEKNLDTAVAIAKHLQDEYEKHLPSKKINADITPVKDDEEEMCIVRRLTPTETSRLQGFPDDYTKIDGEDTADAPQFKAHGNSWATPCAYFVNSRIEMELRRLGHEGIVRYATCCSGIEAHSVSVANLDWEAQFFSEIEPFPCRVLEHHYPNVPNLGDMTQIHFDSEKGVITNTHKEGEEYSLPSCFKEAPIQEILFKEGDLEVFSGGTPCWAKGAMVLTAKGYKPIENVVVGDMVVTHRGRLRKVLKVGHKMPKALVEVKCHSRATFKVTPDHRFYTAHSRKNGAAVSFSSFGFRSIEEIGIGGYLMQPNNFDYPEIPNELIAMKPYKMSLLDILEFAGWYVGDGYTRTWKGRNKRAVVLCLNNQKVEDFRRSFGDRINFSLCGKIGNEQPIQITCTRLANWLLAEFGTGSKDKKIPAWLIAAPKDYRDAFMRGYSLTDGMRNVKSGEFQGTTISPAIAYGIADILRKTAVGYYKMAPERAVKGVVYKQHDQYRISKAAKSGHFKPADDSKYYGVVVQKITPCEIEEVYNIEVEEDHSYICNGLVSSNCQDVSVAGKRAGMSEQSGTRSSLAFHYQRIIDELNPTFTLWEQVPGVFSSNGGADFIWFVNRCAESGYAMAWRVLDAQYVMTEEFPRAVPQRRRRVWMVGYRGNDWRIPARIVFELEKDLTANPPERVSGLGFKDLTDNGIEKLQCKSTFIEESKAKSDASLFGLVMESDDGRKNLLKVSKFIDFKEMPNEGDFSKVSMADIYSFVQKVGKPGYIGSVIRTDKKKKKSSKKIDDTIDLFSMMDEEAPAKAIDGDTAISEDAEEEEDWVGAEKITPAILENIGNAGILANGRICTMVCHEWTSGIQLSPSTYSAWEESVKDKEWLEANEFLPEAYDETVCGLSDVLTENPDEKYNLSWRACFGILKRAETRGKELPPALEIALVSSIRENESIVKWVALNGKNTKKNEGDVTERESARMCFDKYIASVHKFEDVIPIPPRKKNNDDEMDEEEIEEGVALDEDGNPIEEDGL